jgi:hypothetical protein
MIEPAAPSEGATDAGSSLKVSPAAAWVLLVLYQAILWPAYFLALSREGTGLIHRSPLPTEKPLVAGFGVLISVAYACFTIAFARNPARRIVYAAIFAVGTITSFVYTFGAVYYEYGTTHNWTSQLSHLDALFVAVGTLTTGGTGDLQPQSELARGLLLAEMVTAILVFTTMVTVVIHRYLTDG